LVYEDFNLQVFVVDEECNLQERRNPHRFLYKEHFHKRNINLPEKRDPSRFLYKEHFHKRNINLPEKRNLRRL
jgi:hypothetical protein